MTQVFANNAFSFLTGDITPTAQDITVRSADAALFPQPDQARGETFMVTLENRATNKMEITECFRRIGPTLSLRRAREGTSPESFPAGSSVSNRLTAGVIQGGLLGWSEFNRRYLGAYATQPTLDPLGFPLQRGAIMYDLNTDALFVFTVDGWVKWSPSGDLQTGIPPGGVAGDVLTRNSQGLIQWSPSSDLVARDTAQLARNAATAAQTTANNAVTSVGTKVDRAGDTMSGPLVLAPGADATGRADPVLTMNGRGVGEAFIRYTRNGGLFADLVLTANSEIRYVRYAGNTQVANRRVLTDIDALLVSGGVVNGPTTFGISAPVTVNTMFQALAGARLRNTELLAEGNEGGQITWQGGTGHAPMVQDMADGFMRFYRGTDGAMLMSVNNNNGQVSVPNGLVTGSVTVNSNVLAGGAVYSNFFRFDEVGRDTGFDSSGDGYGTIISNGQPVLQAQPGGNVYVWGNITAFSDRRMKEDIGIIEDPLDLIDRMVGVTFVKVGDETRRRQVGFIAQDVEDVLPDLIQRSLDGMMGVNYAAYVSVLNEGIKALHQRIKRLEAAAHG